MLLLAWLAHHRRGAVSAALFATAAGFGFALQADITKLFATQFGSGLGAIPSSWTTYALILSAPAGFALQQSAIKTRYLAPAMAVVNTTTLSMSILLGATLFQESTSRGEGCLLPAVIGLVISIVGVILLSLPEN